MKKIFILILISTFLIQTEVIAKDKTLQNPRITKNDDMLSGQVVTWDCVWFGTYPQAEVVPSKSDYDGIVERVLVDGDLVENPQLYNALKNANGWDQNGNIVYEGKKYRRIKKYDATFTVTRRSGYNYDGYYYWNNASDYHYFLYEPIKWRVISVEDEGYFLLSDKVLDSQRYNEERCGVTWETSTIRSFLNGYGSDKNNEGINYSSKFNFYDSAFDDEEKQLIKAINITNNNNRDFGTDAGQNTVDRVFYLSEDDLTNKKYGFTNDKSIEDEGRRCFSSSYTKAMGAYYEPDHIDYYIDPIGVTGWGARTPGEDNNHFVYVWYRGDLDNEGVLVDGGSFVRPAIFISKASLNLIKYAGVVSSNNGKKTSRLESVEVSTITSDKDTYLFLVLDGETGEYISDIVWWKDNETNRNVTGKNTGFSINATDSFNGTHNFYFAKEGYNAATFTLDVKKGGGKIIPIKLEPCQDGLLLSSLNVSTELNSGKKTETVDVLSGKSKYVNLKDSKYVKTNATWKSNANNKTITSYMIAQTEYTSSGIPKSDIIGTFKIGEDSVIPIDKFKSGDIVYVRAIASDGSMGNWEKTNLVFSNALYGVGIDLGSDISFSLPQNIPVIGGKTFKVNGWEDLPVQTSLDDGKLKVGINLMSVSDTSGKPGEMSSVWSEEQWNNIKEWGNSTEKLKGKKLAEKWKDFNKQRGDAFKRDAFSLGDSKDKTTLKVDIWGYLEGDYLGDEKTVSGKLVMTISSSVGTCVPYSLAGVPMVLTIDLDGKIEGELNAESTFRELSDLADNIKLSGKVKSELGITVGSGPGVGDLGYIVVDLNGTIGTTLQCKDLIQHARPDIKTELTISGGVTAKFLFWKARATMAKHTYLLYESSKDNGGINLKSIMNSLDYTLDCKENANCKYDYNVNRVIRTSSININDDSEIIYSDIDSESKVFIVNNNSTKMAIFTIKNSSRTEINQNMLVYSIYDENTKTWSEAKAVLDDETCDYYPCVVHNSDNIYLAWVNLNSVMNSDDVTMESSAAATEIVLAKFNDDNNMFDVVFSTDNEEMDYAPSLSLVNDTILMTWIKNKNNNLICNDDSNSIEFVRYDDNGLSQENTIIDQESNVLETIAGKIGDTECVVYINDIDGDYLTVDDRKLNICDLEGKIINYVEEENSISHASFCNIMGQNKLLWSQNNIVYQLNSAQDTPKPFINDTAVIDGAYQLCDSEKYVYLTYLTHETGEELTNDYLTAYIYDKQNSMWSESTKISDDGAYVNNYCADVNRNGEYEIAIADNNITLSDDEYNIKSDLRYAVFNPDADIAIDNILYDDFINTDDGNKLDITVSCGNKGEKFITGVKIQLLDGETIIDEKECQKIIVPGGISEIEETLSLPNEIAEEKEFTVRVLPIEEVDYNSSDNEQIIKIGYANLDFSDGEYYSYGHVHAYSVNVVNNGVVDTAGKVELHEGSEDGKLLKTIDIEELKSGEIQNICIVINSEELEWEDGQDVLKCCLVLDSTVVEKDKIQNVSDFYVSKANKNAELTACTISFVGDDDIIGELPEMILGNISEVINLPDQEFERDGYKFKGWSDGESLYQAGAEYSIQTDVEMIAVWDEADDSDIEACHHFNDYIYNNDVTCEENGTKTRTCRVCGYKQTVNDNEHSALGHDYEAPLYSWSADYKTCTATKKCKKCNQDIEETIDSVSTVTPATCEDDGMTTYTATFTKEGFVEQTMSIDINANGHQYGTLIPEVPSTCTEDGVKAHYECSVCHKLFVLENESYTEKTVEELKVPAKGHTLDQEVAEEKYLKSAADCTHSAIYYKSCVCGEKGLDTFEYGDALGHNYGTPTYKWSDDGKSCVAKVICENDVTHIIEEEATINAEITIPSTCKEKGITTYTATFENELFTMQKKEIRDVPLSTIHVLGDAGIEDEVKANCEADGSYEEVVYCSVCGKELNREKKIVNALGHDWDEWTVQENATENANGKEIRSCKREGCTQSESRDIPMLTHIHKLVKNDSKDSTCKEEGTIEYWFCKECGKMFADEGGKSEINKEDIIVSKLAHTPADLCKEKEIAPTCETDGSYDEVIKCSKCGEEISRKSVTVNALGHDWDEWTVTKEATEKETGIYTRVCKNNSEHKETKEIPVLNHIHNIITVAETAATCINDGMKAHYRCSGCDLLFEDKDGKNVILDEASLITKGSHQGGKATCNHKAICDLCHQEYGELRNHIPAKTIKENVTEPTYEKGGSYDEVIKCSLCGEELSRKTIRTDSLVRPDNKDGSKKDKSSIPMDKEDSPVVKAKKEGASFDVEEENAKFIVISKENEVPAVEYKMSTDSTSKIIIIPQTVKVEGVTYNVTKIANEAFKNNKKVEKVIVGENIEIIGQKAFYGCKKLKFVVISGRVRLIEKYAFKNCKNLKTITIKSTKLTKGSIGKNAFKGINKKATFKCPKKQLKNYKKWIKKAGTPKTAKYKKQ